MNKLVTELQVIISRDPYKVRIFERGCDVTAEIDSLLVYRRDDGTHAVTLGMCLDTKREAARQELEAKEEAARNERELEPEGTTQQ